MSPCIPESTIFIADAQHVKHRVDQLKYRSEDIKGRLGPILRKLWNPERELHFASPNIDFKSLAINFPHFKEVIDYYENVVIILSKLKLPFEITPILLVGDPGLGKTYFASELAKVLGLAFHEISLATTTSIFALSGGDIQWAEGSPGFICETLAKSKIANPMIMIDELDKSSGESKYNAMNVFYGLLETHTAKRFRDEALSFELDASKIVWIATANELHRVPEPIKSRLKIFHIRQPEKAHMAIVVKSIYEKLIENKGFKELLSTEMNDSVLNLLSTMSPREVKLILEEATFKAIRNDHDKIEVSDLTLLRLERSHVGFI